MSEKKFNIAVLIDGDNAQATLIKEIISEVSKYGKATIRRIYGDWTSSTMKSWKDVLNEYSINPIQKFSYTKSKNSTDSALIIDAMDILHNKSVEGFCIVSSDSDFTGLAKRIREECCDELQGCKFARIMHSIENDVQCKFKLELQSCRSKKSCKSNKSCRAARRICSIEVDRK